MLVCKQYNQLSILEGYRCDISNLSKEGCKTCMYLHSAHIVYAISTRIRIPHQLTCAHQIDTHKGSKYKIASFTLELSQPCETLDEMNNSFKFLPFGN